MELAQHKAIEAVIDEVLEGRVEQAIRKTVNRLMGPAAKLEELKRKEYLTEAEIGALFSISTSSIRSERSRGLGPSYIKDGRRILYSKHEVAKYLEERRVITKFRR
jgi:hypothetical protein